MRFFLTSLLLGLLLSLAIFRTIASIPPVPWVVSPDRVVVPWALTPQEVCAWCRRKGSVVECGYCDDGSQVPL